MATPCAIRIVDKRGVTHVINRDHFIEAWATGQSSFIVLTSGKIETSLTLDEIEKRFKAEPTKPAASNTPWDEARGYANYTTGPEMKPTRY